MLFTEKEISKASTIIETTLNVDITAGTMAAAEIMKHAYMLTQYAKGGSVGYDDLTEYILKECMDDIKLSVSDVNEYLEANNYYDEFFYSMDEFNDILISCEPLEIARMCYYGMFDYHDDYFYFNAYGNINTCNENDIISDYEKDVKKWMLENDSVPMWADCNDICINADEIISACNYLLSIGY